MVNHTENNFTLGYRNTGNPPMELSHFILWCILYIIIALMALTGNLLIITVFANRRSVRTRTNYFIMGLATADILVSTVTIPLWLTLVGLMFTQRYKKMRLVQNVFGPFDIFSGMLSILHLMVISLERLYAIAMPLRHRRSSARNNLVVLFIVWSTGGLISAASVFLPKGSQWKGTLILFSCLGFFVPFSIICLAYVSILVIVKNKTYVPRSRSAKIVKVETKLALTTFALIMLFLITWLPFFSMNFVLFLCTKCTFAISFHIILLVKAMHYSGSALNPIVYSARMPEFRRPIKVLLRERRFSHSSYYDDRRKRANKPFKRKRRYDDADLNRTLSSGAADEESTFTQNND